MNKIRVIDLLNKIANGEEVPEKIIFNDVVWEYENHIRDYRSSHNNELLFDDEINNKWLVMHLNTKVEIIEEPQEHKIPKKIKIDNEDRIQALSTGNYCYKVKQIDKIIIYKINEILDYLEEIK